MSISVNIPVDGAELTSSLSTVRRLADGWFGRVGFAAIEPLAGLHCLENVEIKGYVKPELKDKLIYVMTKNERKEIPRSNTFDRMYSGPDYSEGWRTLTKIDDSMSNSKIGEH